MEGLDYKVSFIENLSLYNTAVNRISEIQEILNTISTNVTSIIESEEFTGTAADNIKTYASEIHLPLIGAVQCMLCEYQSKLLLYQMNYYNIDDDYATKFNAQTMSSFQDEVISYNTKNVGVSNSISSSLSSVADIVSLPNPSWGNLGFDLQWMAQKVNTLDSSICGYENEHSTDLDSLADFIANLETFISYYKDNVNPGEYKSGDCASNIYAYQLYESMQMSQEFLKEHENEINAAGEKLKAVADQMQADYDAAVQARIDQGRAEIIKGLALVVVGTVAIVATAGTATPLVATAICVTGGCTIAYGASNTIEGIGDVVYGMQGDLSSYAFNPIRDTVFFGNQQIYDIWGQANVFVLSILTPGAGAYSEAVQAGYTGFQVTKAVSIAVAKEMAINFAGDQATGVIVDFMDEHIGLNQTEEAIAEMVIGAALDPGTYETMGKIGGKLGGKVDAANIAELGSETNLADTNLSFADMMSPEDAARYNQWSADCANGTHNNFPGLKEADVAAWKFGDVKLNDASVMAGIDESGLSYLSRENVKVEINASESDASITPINGGEETVTYRRVQGGGEGNKTSQERILIDDDGNIFIPDTETNLNVSIDNGEHSSYYLREKRPGGVIVEFEVPKWFDDMVREFEIPQEGARTNPRNQGGAAPKVGDPTTPGKCVEFPAPWIEWINEYATNGRIVK